ncbi:lysozyme [Actinoallomurus spadix]|uniref:Lysozyme n=1 Tax=Actinoallomurus spadix TaxID=79912 RepID=A0ABP3H1K8_9ACTN|nr:lysozyme [Actinoallomurus spadix]MCO5987062.1 lysozyme [Actinoallomurus spadix]
MAPSPRTRIARRLTTAFAALAVAGGVLAAAPAAGASPNPITHPDQDHAGSGLAARSTSGGTVSPLVAGLPGLDVSSHQGNVGWSTVKSNGARFAYVKATEGTSYQNPYFSQQYVGSYNVGLIRGAYHFATPNTSSGAAQADYFAAHGGGWSRDNQTLPGALDIEYNPYGATCYGLSQSSMKSWIHAFINEYHAKTGRWAVIYTTLDWWKSCTGNNDATFASNSPLWIAKYSTSAGTLPYGWSFYTFWQYADSGTFPGDQDTFNGDSTRLLALANNT